MKNLMLLVLNLVLVTLVSAETVYKTRDAEGNIIFSDVPDERAEIIEIEDAQIINNPDVKTFKYTPFSKKEKNAHLYSRLVISSPENDDTIRSNEGNVSVKVELEPVLFEKDLLVLFMDGKEVSSGKSLQFPLTNLERGTHTVNVAVRNEKDKILKRSSKLVFHLRKASKLFKKATANTTGITTTTPDSGNNSSSPIPTP